jgi:hypothetical protein
METPNFSVYLSYNIILSLARRKQNETVFEMCIFGESALMQLMLL